MEAVDVVTALVILVGLVGVVVPVLPGLLLIGVALVGWAAYVGGAAAWSVALAGVLVLVLGTGLQYLLAGRHLRSRGVPNRTLLVGGIAGIAGFFVIPVVGLPVGFVLGTYVAELQRVGRDRAWPATKHALAAVGIAMLIELAAGFTAASIWVAGVVAT